MSGGFTPQYVPPATPMSNPTARPKQRRGLLIGAAVVLFLVTGAVMLWFFARTLGWHTTAISAGFAALPLFVVVPMFLWLDRLEAEPVRYLAFAFLWGAVCATLGALILNTSFEAVLIALRVADSDMYSAVVGAPIVEETLKGAAILIILFVRRREFDGVIDGVVYAGMVGSGFAFVENILYLGSTIQSGEDGRFAFVFVVRCLMGPFAHPLFTAAIGIGLGLAVASARTMGGRWAYALCGWVVAVCLHAIWNLSATIGMFESTYALFQVPLFIGFLALFYVLRRRENRMVGTYLSQYADAGWLTHPEVHMLASLANRRSARKWAVSQGGKSARSAMVAFQDTASALALLRSRMVAGAAGAAAQAHEYELLTHLTTQRAAFIGR